VLADRIDARSRGENPLVLESARSERPDRLHRSLIAELDRNSLMNLGRSYRKLLVTHLVSRCLWGQDVADSPDEQVPPTPFSVLPKLPQFPRGMAAVIAVSRGPA
jgi:hypothetical protein